MSWEGPVIKAGLDLLNKAVSSLQEKGKTKKQREAVSTVIAELLKLDPDITTAEA